jgi:hypothetical protein
MVRYGAETMFGADRQVREHVRVVAGEVEQVGLVDDAADLGEVALRVLDGDDVGVLGGTEQRLVLDRDARTARDVVEDDRQVGRVGDHAEVREDAGLRGLVVVRRDDHDAVGAGLLAGLVQLDGVGGLVRAATRDDLRAPRRDRLADLDELELLGVGQGAGLARRARDDDAVGTRRDAVVDVLLDRRPVDLAVGGEGGDESDEDLPEGVADVRHVDQRTVSPRADRPSDGEGRPGQGATRPFVPKAA